MIKEVKATNMARFAAFELRLREIGVVLSAIHQLGIDCVLLKGVPLALNTYRSPHHRPSSDTDILIDRAALPLVEKQMLELGYVETPDMLWGSVSQQKQFSRLGKSGIEHVFDFHVELSNRPLLAPFSYDHFSERADVATVNGCEFRIPKRPEAFILSSLHRLGHLENDRRFLWLYDLLLLARQMDADDWNLVSALAERIECKALIGEEICQLADLTNDLVPVDVVEWAERYRGEETEVSAYYLKADRTRRTDLVLGIRTLPTVSLRIRAIGLLVFPRARYMREQYGEGGRWGLVTLYSRRFFRIFSKQRSGRS